MKNTKKLFVVFSIVMVLVLIGCGGTAKPLITVVELDNKGNAIGQPATPEWVTRYVTNGTVGLQAMSEFRDVYCIVGEESSTNRSFALAWADNFSAQQRVGAMIRTNIASEYQARVQGAASAVSDQTSTQAAATYQQAIDSSINAIVNVSYSGVQRVNDWWVHQRRYDIDNRDVYRDEYTAWVLYIVPKAVLNEQVARALTTSVSADSALYEITIEMARQIMQNGLADWGAN